MLWGTRGDFRIAVTSTYSHVAMFCSRNASYLVIVFLGPVLYKSVQHLEIGMITVLDVPRTAALELGRLAIGVHRIQIRLVMLSKY